MMGEKFYTRKDCRHCGSEKLVQLLDLNDQPPANALVTSETIHQERVYPLRLMVCEECQLVQLRDVVDLDELFQGYVYFTGGAGATTPKHFAEYAADMIERFSLTPDSLVVEMGSNDGLLLQAFKEQGIKNVLGIDPARNVAEVANAKGITTLAEPWSTRLAEQIVADYGLADVVIGNNVVAHIDDHQDLFAGVKAILKPSGVFVFEAPYLVDMFENLTFDTIYHEHLSCLSLRPVQRMVESKGLEVFDTELKPVHGVSMRTFIGHVGAHPVQAKVNELVAREIELGMETLDAYRTLAERIEKRRSELLALLTDLKQQGKRIAGYGAPAKSSTIINYLGLDQGTLEYLTEELPSKVGKFSPGAHIPLRHISEARQNPPDYFVLFAWNYADSILEKEKALREQGVKFIIPVGEHIKIL